MNEGTKVPQWATETTLQNLVTALDAGSKKSGSTANKATKATDAFSMALTKAAPGPSKLAGAAMDAASGLINFGTTLVKAALTTTGDLDTFADTIRAGGEAFNDFASNFGIIGRLFGATVQATAEAQALALEVVSDLEKEFASLAVAGADFDGSLKGMNQQAMQSRVNLDKLAEIVQNQGLVFAQSAGTVQDGVDAFLKLNAAVTEGELNFRALGLRFDEVAQMTADYVEIQARAGRRIEIDSDREKTAVQDYIARTATLAKLQGKAADQVSEELRTASLDGAVQARLSMMTGDAANNFRAISQTLETNFGPGVRRAAEQALTLGTVLPDTAKTLAAAGVDLGQFEKMIVGATESDPAMLLDNIGALEQMLGERFADPTTRQIAMLGMVSDVGEGVAETFGKMAPLIETLAEEGGVLDRYAQAHEQVLQQMQDPDYGDQFTRDLLETGQDIEMKGFEARDKIITRLADTESLLGKLSDFALGSTDTILDILDKAFGPERKVKFDPETAEINAGQVVLITAEDIAEANGMPARKIDMAAFMTPRDTDQYTGGGYNLGAMREEAMRELGFDPTKMINEADLDKSGALSETELDKLVIKMNEFIEQNKVLAENMKTINKTMIKGLPVRLE